MTRLFGRGQLKVALLQVAAELGSANGYALMQALGERIGGSWQPSPGAVYPALLSLEDAGLLLGSDGDGGRSYTVTDAGRRTLADGPDVIDAVADRARAAPPRPTTVGAVLDRLVAAAPHRAARIDAATARTLEDRFRSVLDEIDRTIA